MNLNYVFNIYYFYNPHFTNIVFAIFKSNKYYLSNNRYLKENAIFYDPILTKFIYYIKRSIGIQNKEEY